MFTEKQKKLQYLEMRLQSLRELMFYLHKPSVEEITLQDRMRIDEALTVGGSWITIIAEDANGNLIDFPGTELYEKVMYVRLISFDRRKYAVVSELFTYPIPLNSFIHNLKKKNKDDEINYRIYRGCAPSGNWHTIKRWMTTAKEVTHYAYEREVAKDESED